MNVFQIVLKNMLKVKFGYIVNLGPHVIFLKQCNNIGIFIAHGLFQFEMTEVGSSVLRGLSRKFRFGPAGRKSLYDLTEYIIYFSNNVIRVLRETPDPSC